MKLELKHLAPYLPYGLILIQEDLKTKVTLIGGMLEGNIGTFKPILRPLSDLTKEIQVNERTFNPYDTKILNDFMMGTSEWDCLCEYTGDLTKNADIPYYIVEQLFEWHFDVFGLIDQDLAIDINTLTKTT